MKMSQRFIITSQAICFCTISIYFLAVFNQKADFTGIWLISEQKCEFGGQPAATMFKGIKVVQSKDSLSVFGMRFNDTAISTKATSYPLNGNTVKTVLSNNRTMTASLNWSADGKTLTRNSSYSPPNDPETEDYKSQEAWSLSDDKKTLTLTRTFSTASGNVTVKAVYEKQ